MTISCCRLVQETRAESGLICTNGMLISMATDSPIPNKWFNSSRTPPCQPVLERLGSFIGNSRVYALVAGWVSGFLVIRLLFLVEDVEIWRCLWMPNWYVSFSTPEIRRMHEEKLYN